MPALPRAAVATLALALLGACGGDDPPRDGGASDAGTDAAASLPVTPPDIPWLDVMAPPVMTPCPTGWRAVADADVATCDPYPEAGVVACEAGEAHFAGEASCRAIGDACPSGDYADALPARGAFFVQAGAPAGGDGSRASPYSSLSAVPWSSLGSGAVVALAKGTYAGALVLRPGVRVVGACAAETRVTGGAPGTPAVWAASAGDAARVENVGIVDPPYHGVQAANGARLVLDGVALEGCGEVGAVVDGAGTELELIEVVVRGTRPRASDGGIGRGISVQNGGRLRATRLVVEDNREAGVIANHAGTEAILEDAVIRDTGSRERDGSVGHGVAAIGGARIEASRTLVERNHEAGIYGSGMGTRIALTDVVVRDTLPQVLGAVFGRGLSVEHGVEVTASRLLLERNRDAAVWASDGIVLVLSDVIARNTEARMSDRLGGAGIYVADATRLELARALVAENRTVGISGITAGTELLISDVVVRGTRTREADGVMGHGIHVGLGARLDLERALVERNAMVAVAALDLGTEAALRDVVVRDTLSEEYDGAGGHGVHAQDDARITGARVRVEGGRILGVTGHTRGVLEMEDVRVDHVDVSSCAATTCPETPYGYGAAALDGGFVRLTRFAIRDSATCGVMVSSAESAADLDTGVISGSPIGACVQVDGYDLARLSRGVEYRDNGVSLDSTTLPVPGTSAPIEVIE